MSLWSRFTNAVRSVLGRESSYPKPDFTSRDYGYDRDADTDAESFLPPGWSIVGLYHDGEQTQKIHATDDTEVTDNDIAHADAIIVHYGPGGSDGYKWIHGANDWESIADQIAITIVVVSPKGTSSE